MTVIYLGEQGVSLGESEGLFAGKEGSDTLGEIRVENVSESSIDT